MDVLLYDNVTEGISDLSELNSAQFKDLSDASEPEDSATATPSSTYDTSSYPPTATQRLQKRRKRSKRATTTWSFARNAYEGERTRCPRGQLLWYCKFCSNYKTLSTSSARAHLKSIHDIHIQAEGGIVKKNTTVELRSLFQRQHDRVRLEQALKDQTVLKAALDKDVVHESLI